MNDEHDDTINGTVIAKIGKAENLTRSRKVELFNLLYSMCVNKKNKDLIAKTFD